MDRKFEIGDRILHTDEFGFTMPEMVIEEFRETEVVARTRGGDEYRIDPADLFNGNVRKARG